MPRSPRIEFPGAVYHVLARGDRREPIVWSDEDRWMFLHTLGAMCARTGARVHAWALMDNHYHLLLETPKANLVAGMSWFQNTYTRRFNSRNRQWGHLFGGRYPPSPRLRRDRQGGGRTAPRRAVFPAVARLHPSQSRAGRFDRGG